MSSTVPMNSSTTDDGWLDCDRAIEQGASVSTEAYLSDDLSYVFMPGNETAIAAMQECCGERNPVGKVGKCTLFCELPDDVGSDDDSQTEFTYQFTNCLEANNWTTIGIGTHVGDASRPTIAASWAPTAALVVVLGFWVLGH